MTGYRSSAFRWDCSRSGCYNDNLPSWDYLMSAFPRGIMPTDVDGMAEVNGHFLFIEQKREGASVPRGQMRALKNLSLLSVKITVLLLKEAEDGSGALKVSAIKFGVQRPWEPMSKEQLREKVRAWAVRADSADRERDDGAA